MTRLTDDELARHLERRMRASPLEGEPRHELLAAISDGARAMPRRRFALAWQRMRWLGAAAAAVTLVLVAVLELPPRGLTPGPSPTSPPSIGITPTALPSPASTRWSVLNAKALAAAASDPASYGTVIIADVELGVRQPEGYVFVQSTNPEIVVSHLDPVQALAGGVYAFRVWSGEVETLGRVALHDRDRAWTVDEIRALPDFSGEGPVDLYPVLGWLVGGASSPEEAWLTTNSFEPVGKAAPPADAITLQEGAYFDLAPDPAASDRGTTEPRLGVYLIRPGDCTGGDTCPAQLVGTLDPPAPRQPTGLSWADGTPVVGRFDHINWHQYPVQICNETSNYADFVGADARLLLLDGTLVRAAGRQVDALGDQPPEPRLDTITLSLLPGGCAEGWLVFGTASDAAAAQIQWHGRVLDLASGADTTAQSAMLSAVAQWLKGAELGLSPGPLYVDEMVAQELRFRPERIPDLAAAGEPLFGETLTDSSKAAIQFALAGRNEVHFIPDPAAVVDPNGLERFGCRPYLDRWPMLHFGAPRQAGGDAYLIEVSVDRGCQGEVYLVRIARDDGGYTVTTVVSQGIVIV